MVHTLIQILLAILWLFMIPIALGLPVTKFFPKNRQKIELALLNGYLVMIALFHCFYLVFLVMKSTNFGTLAVVFGIFIAIVSLLSAWFGKDALRECRKGINKDKTFWKWVFILIVAFQLMMRLLQQVSDGDDAFFIATATAAWGGNTMNLIQPYTGFSTPVLDLRHAFSSAPIWLAFLSEMTLIHPAIMGHSVLSLIMILLHYIVIVCVGDVLFQEDQKKKYLFASVIAFFNMYGFVSIYTAQTFFLTRTWQGKSIFANLFVPLLFLNLLWISEKREEEKEKNIYFVFAAGAMFGATAMTTMAAFMNPLIFMIGIICLSLIQKKPALVWKGMISCVPACLVGAMYLLA